ncbi:MAG: precorrin-3B synthase [Corynebacterium sp.]|nr:precorrin-3B synthase [Corynebacterium sp.]
MCPGIQRLHKATDGYIGRVRFPGGHIRGADWRTLAHWAETLGDGRLHVTKRGNLQFRGIQKETDFSQAAIQVGYVPSPQHDKIRNIIVSARDPHLWELAKQIDEALLSTEATAGLSGRTLFGIDAGRGDILVHRPDFGAIAVSGGNYQLIVAGNRVSVRIPNEEAIAATLCTAAAQWQALRGASWRLAERPEVHEHIVAAVLQETAAVADKSLVTGDIATLAGAAPVEQLLVPDIGWFEDETGVTLGAGLPFGFLDATTAAILGELNTDTAITAGACLMIHGLTPEVAEAVVRILAPRGIIFDANSPLLRVTACTGLPGCAKALSHTQEDALALVASGDIPDGFVHFSGCARRCGHPLGHYVEYLAEGEGEYEVQQR